MACRKQTLTTGYGSSISHYRRMTANKKYESLPNSANGGGVKAARPKSSFDSVVLNLAGEIREFSP
jgi:hypothetical protein